MTINRSTGFSRTPRGKRAKSVLRKIQSSDCRLTGRTHAIRSSYYQKEDHFWRIFLIMLKEPPQGAARTEYLVGMEKRVRRPFMPGCPFLSALNYSSSVPSGFVRFSGLLLLRISLLTSTHHKSIRIVRGLWRMYFLGYLRFLLGFSFV